jgi:transcriptional regulator with XRE-family HTH domain
VDSWEFGSTLRHWRDGVAPAKVGLAEGRRRRATGLRREEVAELAGISVDYLTRLEQGRATSPSTQVVEALARALRLTDAERDLLFRLAGHITPGLDLVSSRITPGVQRLLDRLSNTPVAVYDATWTLVTANAPYDALMGQTTNWRGIERNSIWRHLIGAGNRAVQTPEERTDQQARLVADLRLTAARYPTDPRLKRLIRELAAQSPRFVELWAGNFEPHQDQGRHKIIDHPDVGHITLDCDTLVAAADDLRIMIFTAEPETEDAERLALATVLGTQSLID